eukprot:gene18264-biopygen20431
MSGRTAPLAADPCDPHTVRAGFHAGFVRARAGNCATVSSTIVRDFAQRSPCAHVRFAQIYVRDMYVRVANP